MKGILSIIIKTVMVLSFTLVIVFNVNLSLEQYSNNFTDTKLDNVTLAYAENGTSNPESNAGLTAGYTSKDKTIMRFGNYYWGYMGYGWSYTFETIKCCAPSSMINYCDFSMQHKDC
jgi:hypothetical protein